VANSGLSVSGMSSFWMAPMRYENHNQVEKLIKQLINLTWGVGAVAPFQAWVVPIGQQPFIYNIPASAYTNGQGQYQVSSSDHFLWIYQRTAAYLLEIQVQLNQGTNYVMLMSDARGIGSGTSPSFLFSRMRY
jgi:hypothetical protein